MLFLTLGSYDADDHMNGNSLKSKQHFTFHQLLHNHGGAKDLLECPASGRGASGDNM